MKYSHTNKILVSIIILTCFFIIGCSKAPRAVRTAKKYLPNAVESAEKYLPNIVKPAEKYLPNTVKPAEKLLPKVGSLISVPRTEKESVSMFERKMPTSKLNSTLRAGKKFLRAGHELLTSRQQLLNVLDDGTELCFLVGHNHNGNFMLPDGSSISFETISKATRDNKIVVLLSCNSNEFASPGQIGISREIYYDEAYTILNKMLKDLDNRTDLDLSNQSYDYTVGEIERMLQNADKRAYIYYRVRKSAPLTITGGSIIGGGSITYLVRK